MTALRLLTDDESAVAGTVVEPVQPPEPCLAGADFEQVVAEALALCDAAHETPEEDL